MQLASALARDHVLKPLEEKIATSMTVTKGLAYMEEPLARFFEAGLSAKRMRVDEEQIVKMKPLLTNRASANGKQYP